jgi:isopentenyl-diphosphate delta-isomerase type 1
MEYLDILNEDGTQTGNTAPREQAHKEGLWHLSVHVWLINEDKQILIQKRSENKDSFPGMWDISCGGHVVAGDRSFRTVIKEVFEELGIILFPADVKFIKSLKKKSISNNGKFIDHEINDVFIVKCREKDLDKFIIQTEELSEVKWINLEELKTFSTDFDTVFPYYEDEITLVENYLN